MANIDYSRVEADLFDALMSAVSFDNIQYDFIRSGDSVTLANRGDLRGELASFLGAKEGRVILKYDKVFRAILSITIRYENIGDMAEKLKRLLSNVEDVEDYDIVHPYDEDELIEDGLYFTLLDLSVEEEDSLYDKATAIVRCARKLILTIG